MKKPKQTGPIITPIGHSTMYDYAPLSHTFPRTIYDLAGDPCGYIEAIKEAETAIKH